MSETLIGFTDLEITQAKEMLRVAKERLQEAHDASHSGVDKLLLNSWVIDADKLIAKFEARGVKHIEVHTEDLVRPEA